MRHIPSLDGLRTAFAALVIAHHLGLPLLSGGWVGVDAFFVLSGFLITRLLLAERERLGRIRLIDFYVKRAARLYPALILMVGLALVLQTERPKMTAAVALTYTQDVVWMLTGTQMTSLGHTWSLAIEEHFYLLWPLVFLVVRRRLAIAWTAVLLAAASFAAAALAPGHDFYFVPVGYYMPHTHSGPILAGCALAVMPTLNRPWGKVAVWAGGVGMSVVLAMCDVIPRTAGFAAESLAATVTTCLLISGLVSGEGGFIGRVLALTPMQWLGRISYGMYLFHPPLISALGPLIPWRRSVEALVLYLIIAAVAAASYFLVERPVLSAVRGRLAVRAPMSTVGVSQTVRVSG